MLFCNKYFDIIALTALTLAIYQTINGTVATYYSQYILGNNEYYSLLNLMENIPQVAVIMILAPFIKKFGKRNLCLAGAILAIAGQVMLLFAPASPVFACLAAALRGIGKAPLFGCCFTMMADIVNYGHWKTGVRIQAVIFSAQTVGQKFGGGVTSAVIGKMMDASGFTGLKVEIPSAVAMVQNLYIWGTILAWVFIAFLMYIYKLDKEYDGIMADMNAKGMLKQAE